MCLVGLKLPQQMTCSSKQMMLNIFVALILCALIFLQRTQFFASSSFQYLNLDMRLERVGPGQKFALAQRCLFPFLSAFSALVHYFPPHSLAFEHRESLHDLPARFRLATVSLDLVGWSPRSHHLARDWSRSVEEIPSAWMHVGEIAQRVA